MSRVFIDRPATRPHAPRRMEREELRSGELSAKSPTREVPVGLLVRLVRQAPALLVVAALVAVGVYGHYSDWKLPKFSTLVGLAPTEHDDWCKEHGVPESQCVLCRPELLPRGKDFGWCKEHGVADCPLCHPEVAQMNTTPVVSEGDRQRAARALALAPRQENDAACEMYRRRVQFASLESLRKADVEVAEVGRRRIVESVAVNGRITYDQTRLASLSSRLPGTVWHVENYEGDQVRSGEILAMVDAAEVGHAKTELIQALAQEDVSKKAVNRLNSLPPAAVARADVDAAQAQYLQARARLLGAVHALANLGLTVNVGELRGLSEEMLIERLRWLGLPGEIRTDLHTRVAASQTVANLLPLRSPMDGVIVSRQVVAGEVVDAARVLFQVADLRRMWLSISIPLEEAGRVALGRPVLFRPDGSAADAAGTLVWISATADRQTRMVEARAELPNPDGRLRNETFGLGRIVLREEQEAIAVPDEAVHWEGCCHIVFVRDKRFLERKDSPKVFNVRVVRLGAKTDGYTEIVAGVLPGETVATRGSAVLRGELLKNNLGDGCGCGKQ